MATCSSLSVITVGISVMHVIRDKTKSLCKHTFAICSDF